MLTLPQRSALYRIPLAGEGTEQVESLRSYIQRLAYAHHVVPRRLVEAMFEATPLEAGSNYTLWTAVNDWDVCGNGLVARELLERLEAGTGLSLQTAAMRRFAGVLSPQRMTRTGAPLHCPECIRHTGDDGLPYRRLVWELKAVRCCPVHRVQLTSSRCARHVSRGFGTRSSLPGVCNYCGAVSFSCSISDSVAAMEDELWAAQQLARLVALPPSTPLSLAALQDGIRATVDVGFEGHLTNASLESGLAKSTVFAWLKKDALPSLDSLLKLCWQAGADLSSLFQGRFEPAETPAGAASTALGKRPYQRLRLDHGEVRRVLMAEAAAEAPRSVEKVAVQFGVLPRRLRQIAQAETEQLAAASTKRRRDYVQLRFEQARERFLATAIALREQGAKVTQATLITRSGVKLINNKPAAHLRALESVLSMHSPY